MEAVLRGTAGLLMGVAEKRAERRRHLSRVGDAVTQGVLIQALKFLLHLGGFGAFIWAMFEVHSVAGGLAIMVSCFAMSWIVGQPKAELPRSDPGMRG